MQAAKQGLGKALPNKIPAGQIERLAKFGTVVESCSKKVTLSAASIRTTIPAGVLAAPCYISAAKGKYANSAAH